MLCYVMLYYIILYYIILYYIILYYIILYYIILYYIILYYIIIVQDTKYFFLTGINVIRLQTFPAFDILRTVHHAIFL